METLIPFALLCFTSFFTLTNPLGTMPVFLTRRGKSSMRSLPGALLTPSVCSILIGKGPIPGGRICSRPANGMRGGALIISLFQKPVVTRSGM